MLQLLSKRQIMKDIIYCGMYKIGLVCHFPHNNHFVIDRNAAWSNALLHQADDEDQQYTVEKWG